MRSFILGYALFLSNLCNAEIQTYQSTDNTGINKLERIGVIETYLARLSGTLKIMETKLDASVVKIETMDSLIKSLKEENTKLKAELAEKNSEKNVDPKEVEKLKADILSIKNEDIEKIRIQVQGLNYSVQSVQGLLESQKRSR